MRALSLALTLMALVANAATLPPMTQTPLDIPGHPSQMAFAADGTLWVTDYDANAIGRLTAPGIYTSFDVPTPKAGLGEIAPGPDGNLWFVENAASKIGRIAPDGIIREFMLPAQRYPIAIAAGPDGNVWFIQTIGLGRISTVDGTGTDVPVAGGALSSIVTGPDGNLWVTRYSAGSSLAKILRITPAGAVSEFSLGASGYAYGAIAGPDGNVWFLFENSVGRVTTAGKVTLFPIPTPDANPGALAVGTDGNLWFTEFKARKLAQLVISTAADNGTATINESDALADHLYYMVLVPRGWNASRAAAEEPKCPQQTFIARAQPSSEGPTRLLYLSTPAPATCADVSVGVFLVRKHEALTLLVANGGPFAAQNVRAQLELDPEVGLRVTSAAASSGSCGWTSTIVVCEWPALAPVDLQFVLVGLEPVKFVTARDARGDAFVISATPDPDRENNDDEFGSGDLRFVPPEGGDLLTRLRRSF